MIDDLDGMAVFVAVAEAKGFRAAGERHLVSASVERRLVVVGGSGRDERRTRDGEHWRKRRLISAWPRLSEGTRARCAPARPAVWRARSWLGGGVHSGYRLDPTGGGDPAGGRDVEGCVLAESGGLLGVCIGLARQALPDAGFSLTWYFLEPRLKMLSRRLLGGARTDFWAGLRLAQAGETGPRHLSPSLLGLSLQLTQHLNGDGGRRGWSIYTAYLHGRLGNVPETEFRDSDRVTAGLTWVP
jgi:hypothetical protein